MDTTERLNTNTHTLLLMPVPFFLTFYCSSPLRWQKGFMLILLVIPAPVRIPHSLSERPHCLNTRAVCCSPSHVIPWPLYSQDLLLALCIGGPSPRLLGTCCLRSELAWEFEAQHPPIPTPSPCHEPVIISARVWRCAPVRGWNRLRCSSPSRVPCRSRLALPSWGPLLRCTSACLPAFPALGPCFPSLMGHTCAKPPAHRSSSLHLLFIICP